MISFSFSKFKIFKRKQLHVLSKNNPVLQIQPLQQKFRCTKDLFIYSKERCTRALKQEKPYEHVILADTKQNKVITEFIGNENQCKLDGIEKLNLDAKNNSLI